MQDLKKVLVTGASGFVASHLVGYLLAQGRDVVTTSRQPAVNNPIVNQNTSSYILDKDGYQASWFEGVSVVVHCAALTNSGYKTQDGQLAEFRAANVDDTLSLARSAAQAGVRRFVFVSSIKVNGEQTFAGRPYRASDSPNPEDAYGISKWEAEQGLAKLCAETGMELVVVRPPLVYGAGVKGNFLAMSRWVSKGMPLPLGAIKNNARSLVSIANLVDLLVTCVDHPKAAMQTFLVSDSEPLSTTSLLQHLAQAFGTKAKLIPVPSMLIDAAAAMVGKSHISRRLTGDLAVDITDTKLILDWQPPESSDEGLRKFADWYMEQV
ncbi:MAG: UDP-glucose 4-epimerase family protein [Pontibacterium sp.]